MPRGGNREDSVLDEIDSLVDWQLSGGDQSDSFHGAEYRDNHPCPWCGEGFHFLPITVRMQEMRAGSYARDEFNQGIVDPEYDYRTDVSGVVCPGSEFHGPIHETRTWDKESRARRASRNRVSAGVAGRPLSGAVVPLLPHGRLRRLRFIGPFEPWTIALDDERVIEDVRSDPSIAGLPGMPRNIPVVREQRLTATFELNAPLRNASQEWILQNQEDIENMTFTREGSIVEMKPLVIPFREFLVSAESPNAAYPDYVEFTTTYRIENHPWFMHFWMVGGTEENPIFTPAHPLPDPPDLREHRCCVRCSEAGHCQCNGERHHLMNQGCCQECTPGLYHHLDHGALCEGQEPDVVIIDEAYEHDDDFLDHVIRHSPTHDLREGEYVQAVENATRQLAEEAQIPPGYLHLGSTEEEDDEAERRQAVLLGSEEAQEGWVRQVAAREQVRALQEAARAVELAGQRAASEAGGEE